MMFLDCPESAMIRCPAGQHFSRSIEALTWDRDGGAARRRDGGAARRDFPGSARRHARRPNSAPAYYLGRPARQWITSMRPRRRRAIGAVAR
ncbi:MAG: hypothetical protein ACRDP5_21800 [Streptosporangiaceae bacterium]